MPIHHPDGHQTRLPRLGKIRLGVLRQKAGGTTFPEEVPYFVLPEDLKALPAFRDEPQPTEITVRFPSDDIARVFDPWYKRWANGILTLRCDGQTYEEQDRQGNRSSGLCKKDQPFKACACGAKPEGALNIVIPTGLLGIYQIPIGGGARVDLLMSQLQFFSEAFAPLGGLPAVEWKLRRVPEQSEYTDKDGKRRTRTGYPVHIIPLYTGEQVAAMRANRQALPSAAGIGHAAPGLAPQVEPAGIGAHEDAADGPVHEEPEEAVYTPAAPQPSPGTVRPATSEEIVGLVNQAVKALGVSPVLYRKYLGFQHPAGPTTEDLAEQEQALVTAIRSGKPATDMLKQAIVQVVNRGLGVPTGGAA